MKIIINFVILFLPVISNSQRLTDSLLIVLDKAINERPIYKEIKNREMDSINNVLHQNLDKKKEYSLYNQLFDAYKHYNLDSALWIAKKEMAISRETKELQLVYASKMNVAEMLGKMGMYKETFDIMGQINKKDLAINQWGYYYHIYHSIYSLLYQNALSQEEKNYYKTFLFQYKDSLIQILNPQLPSYKFLVCNKLIDLGKYNQALNLLHPIYIESKENSAEASAIAYNLAEVYEKKGDSENQKKYLAIASLSDIKRAVKSYIALRKLAVLLYREGNVERAYTYIKCAMEDATFAKARFRMIEISEALPIIVASYNKEIKEEKDTLAKYLILISLLSLILIESIFIIYKQLQKNTKAERLVKFKNEELTKINEELKNLNITLSDSDRVKETYIGYVFDLCSSYINKLEVFRVETHKQLKSKQINEAIKATSNTGLVTHELKEFFLNFDAVFLQLYPNFIDEFNSLLRKEERITSKTEDILTPELRIFALSRLGISDSSKIANFLHFSPQTVYNYKLKIKNKLSVTKEEFSNKIKRIGR
jgi:hypothetical protein